jgi:hypothetical protein
MGGGQWAVGNGGRQREEIGSTAKGIDTCYLLVAKLPTYLSPPPTRFSLSLLLFFLYRDSGHAYSCIPNRAETNIYPAANTSGALVLFLRAKLTLDAMENYTLYRQK